MCTAASLGQELGTHGYDREVPPLSARPQAGLSRAAPLFPSWGLSRDSESPAQGCAPSRALSESPLCSGL